MESVYVITEVNYGEVCWECDTLERLEIFKDKNKALERFNCIIKERVSRLCDNDDWVLENDTNIENVKVGDLIRFFHREQDNWNSYFEVQLHEVKIQD